MTVNIHDVIPMKVVEKMKCKAEYTARMKVTHTMDTWLRKRTPQERFVTLYEGDLAKVALREFFAINSVPHEDYDEERDDNFKYRDKWDIRVKGRYLVEIKSSVESRTTDVETVLSQRRYMVYPGKEADINVQAYYIPRLSGFEISFANFIKNMSEVRRLDLDEIAKQLTEKLKVVYLMGWIGREELGSRQTFVMDPTLTGERGRKHYNVKICEGNKMADLNGYIQSLSLT